MAPTRDVAIVSFAQSDHRRAAYELNEVEMIQPVIHAALDGIGAKIADIGFTCSGSSDYLAGQAFSYVITPDAVGPYPPIIETHVEMDGAWPLDEAWLKNPEGTAIPIGTFSSSKDYVTLWAGASPDAFPIMSVTIEAADNDQTSSGRTVLVGELHPA